MPNFLKRGEILETIKRHIVGSESCDLAVAYWGLGAAKRLGIHKAKKVRIICDAWSGACSPEELSALSQNKKVELRYLDNLHSKVYITPTSIVVGSANASSRGLGDDQGSITNHEAAVELTGEDERHAIQGWFDEQWKASLPLTESEIELLPKPDAAKRVPKPKPTVLDVLAAAPQWFEENNIRIAVYDSNDASDEAFNHYEKIASKVYGKPAADSFDKRQMYPYFELVPDWPISQSDMFICFTASPGKSKPVWDGIWTAKEEKPRVYDDGISIMLLDEHKDVKGLKLSGDDKKLLSGLVKNYLVNTKFAKDKFDQFLDMTLSEFFNHPATRDPWFDVLDPVAQSRIVDFALSRPRTVKKILIGKTGDGKQPNFRLEYADGREDFAGSTYKNKSFRILKGGIKNESNLAWLRD